MYQSAGTRILSTNQKASAVEISLSGRQWMLPQRIALILEPLDTTEAATDAWRQSALRSALLVCAQLMEVSHVALLSRSTDGMSRALGMGQWFFSNVSGQSPEAIRGPDGTTDAPLLFASTALADTWRRDGFRFRTWMRGR